MRSSKPPFRYQNLAFKTSKSARAQQAFQDLIKLYGNTQIEKADAIIVLGGDGFMLDTVRKQMKKNIPIFGMNCGTVGFLMNSYSTDKLYERLEKSIPAQINPLRMQGITIHGKKFKELAINEVSLFRQTHQSAKTKIYLDGKLRLSELVSDGILIATPAGSTAYNYSAHGPILPLNAKILALTPISAFRPRHWRGALLPYQTQIHIEVLNPEHRKVSACADNFEHRNIHKIDIFEDSSLSITLLFDQDQELNERIIREQFAH